MSNKDVTRVYRVVINELRMVRFRFNTTHIAPSDSQARILADENKFQQLVRFAGQHGIETVGPSIDSPFGWVNELVNVETGAITESRFSRFGPVRGPSEQPGHEWRATPVAALGTVHLECGTEFFTCSENGL